MELIENGKKSNDDWAGDNQYWKLPEQYQIEDLLMDQ
jgi:hypothetical protein